VFVVHAPRCSEIDQLDDRVLLVLEVDILRLDVAMYDRVLVQVVDSRDQLANDVSSLDLVEVEVGRHALVQRPTVHHLVDEVDLLLVLVHLDDLANVWMIKLLQQLDLLEKLAPLTKLEVLLAHNLDRASDPGKFVNTASDATKSTLTDDLMQVEVILDVVPMGQVELLRVQLDSMALVR